MPCPLFLPALPLNDFMQEGMPLGDIYGGQCAADSNSEIPSDMLRGGCNFGYARNMCEHARGTETDAARFLIKSDRDGTVEVAWSAERNHHPIAVGTLRILASPIDGIATRDPLERQARACAASYRRRMGKA